MLLDDMQNIIDEYHLIGWGIGCIVIAAILTFFFKDIVGRWIFKKDKISQINKNTVDQYRMEQADKR